MFTSEKRISLPIEFLHDSRITNFEHALNVVLVTDL